MNMQEINKVCCEVYGAGILAVDSVTALWVAERILADTGKNVYRTISKHRNKFGMNTMFPNYGEKLFSGI